MEGNVANPGAGAPPGCPRHSPTPVPTRHRSHSSPVLFFRRLPRKWPEMRCFPRARTPPAPARSPFPSLCQHPRPAPGTALRSCSLTPGRTGPDREGDMGRTSQPYRGSTCFGVITGAPRGPQLCLCYGSAAGGSPPSSSSLCSGSGGTVSCRGFQNGVNRGVFGHRIGL